jgi:hypothetical protein
MGGGRGKHSFSLSGKGEGAGPEDHACQTEKPELLTRLWTSAVINLSYILTTCKCLILQ